MKIRLVGTKSNRTGIGAVIKVTAEVQGTREQGNEGTGRPGNEGGKKKPMVQVEEVRSSNGFFSSSDLRIHFGLGDAKKVDMVEIRWPSGTVDSLKDLEVDRLYVIEEGGKVLKRLEFGNRA